MKLHIEVLMLQQKMHLWIPIMRQYVLQVEVYIAQRIISVILKELEVWLDIFIRLTIQQKLHLHMHQLLCIWLHA